MEITTSQNGIIEMRKVFNPITLITDKGERISICMRDSGFELNYNGRLFSAKNGELEMMSKQEKIKFSDTEVANSHYTAVMSSLPSECQNGWENSDYCPERGKCKKCL